MSRGDVPPAPPWQLIETAVTQVDYTYEPDGYRFASPELCALAWASRRIEDEEPGLTPAERFAKAEAMVPGLLEQAREGTVA